MSSSKHEVPEAVIRKLSDLLKTTDLAEIEIESGDLKVRVRAKEQSVFVSNMGAPAGVATPKPVAGKTEDIASDLHIIRSPFIGTFYRSPSPSSPVFVDLQQTVQKGQTLCIVEAMKLMNEIEADATGVIEKIYVENGTPVEFNTPLFGIRR